MPTYGYQCTECKHEFSVFQSMKDDALTSCPECAGLIKRLLYPVGVIFKGSGWYVNDSRKPEPASDSAPTAAAGASDKPAETPATGAASTPDTKSEPDKNSTPGPDSRPTAPAANK